MLDIRSDVPAMKLSEWLATPNPDGTRKRKGAFAARIGVTQTMVTEYAEGRAIPRPPIMENIARETQFRVLPNDFYNLSSARDALQPEAVSGCQ